MKTLGCKAVGVSHIDKAVLNYLNGRGRLNCKQVCEGTGLSESAVKHSLNTMADNLVIGKEYPKGNLPVYSYDPIRKMMMSRLWTPEAMPEMWAQNA